MLVPISPFHAKSGNEAELPEDHCINQEAPEYRLDEDEETLEA
jgi:hypothetical protein